MEDQTGNEEKKYSSDRAKKQSEALKKYNASLSEEERKEKKKKWIEAGRKSRIGSKHSPESIEKMRTIQEGKKSSDETKAKISQSNKDRWAKMDPAIKKEILHKRAIAGAEASKNREITDEQRNKMSEGGKKGGKRTAEIQSKENLAKWQKAGQEASKRGLPSKIEDIMAKKLTEIGVKFERQKQIGMFRVDFFIESEKTIIEVNGCYWHQCIKCCYDDGYNGNSSEDIRKSDLVRREYLESFGYKVKIVWEHTLA